MQPLIVVVGETASGKSELAMNIAQKFQGEIIAADAMTVYRSFDIGTAKPDATDRERVPHHLIDVADPQTGFTAAEFQQHTYKVIEDISMRRKLPVLVGGSGLYIDSVLYDYGFADQPDSDVRDELNALDLDELVYLAQKSGLSLEGIDTKNPRRLIRLIETSGKIVTKREIRPDTLVLGVTKERHELFDRVEKRVDTMFSQGLEKEVRRLEASYGWEFEPMKSIGYREWQPYFKDEKSLDEVRRQIILDTMKLAKKQRTWFKRNKSIHWIQTDEYDEIVTTFLNKYPL